MLKIWNKWIFSLQNKDFFVEINLKEDIEGDKVFADVHTTTDLYMRLSNFYSSPLGDKTDTLVCMD